MNQAKRVKIYRPDNDILLACKEALDAWLTELQNDALRLDREYEDLTYIGPEGVELAAYEHQRADLHEVTIFVSRALNWVEMTRAASLDGGQEKLPGI